MGGGELLGISNKTTLGDEMEKLNEGFFTKWSHKTIARK